MVISGLTSIFKERNDFILFHRKKTKLMLIKQIRIQTQSKDSGEIRVLQLGMAQLMCRCNLSPRVIIYL